MAMGKKQFAEVAKALCEAQVDAQGAGEEISPLQVKIIVTRLGAAFLRENPRFDHGKFWEACGLGD